MEPVHLTCEKKYADYARFMEIDTKLKLDYYLERLQGKRIAMVNATAFGGGVAEILSSLVPLFRDMGIQLDWWVLEAGEEFYAVTKEFHNALQGRETSLSPRAREIYLFYNERNAATMRDWDYDCVVVHDPQPAALINYRRDNDPAKWVWRCHIDTSTPGPAVWEFLSNFVRQYHACIFTAPDFVKEQAALPGLTFFTPSIDPLSTKNVPLGEEEARLILTRFGIDINRPLITQVSRFDPWKDPLGVIDAYRMIKKNYPSVQLALVGSMASDDPEGWDYLYRTLRKAGEDYDIKIATNFNCVSSLEVNAFQTFSQVLIQKSLREGFGLTVAEGLWKETPVVGGKVGGIKYQIEDEVNGFLVNTVEECAERVLTLLMNPPLRAEMGRAGREKVRKNFLITTNILNYLKLFHKLLVAADDPEDTPAGAPGPRRPL